MSHNPDEWAETSVCADCGAELSPDLDRAFATGQDTYLCFECAGRRGGVFDADRDEWTIAPNVAGVSATA